MINIRTILKLKENDGLTLKKGKMITYKTGYQVATEGIETTSPREAINAVKAYKGDCGVWFSEGIYYIDKSHRVSTKREALEVGKAHNQISVLCWKCRVCIFCINSFHFYLPLFIFYSSFIKVNCLLGAEP